MPSFSNVSVSCIKDIKIIFFILFMFKWIPKIFIFFYVPKAFLPMIGTIYIMTQYDYEKKETTKPITVIPKLPISLHIVVDTASTFKIEKAANNIP